jgi:hypothetical protein
MEDLHVCSVYFFQDHLRGAVSAGPGGVFVSLWSRSPGDAGSGVTVNWGAGFPARVWRQEGVTVLELRLEVREFRDLTRWRWVLTRPGGTLVADHEVRLDERCWQYEAFADLLG